jgi:DNA-binding response OmpR family regulator
VERVTPRPGTRPDGGPACVGRLEVDARRRIATLGGQRLPLTAKELDLLAVLAADAGAVVTRGRLLERIWGVTWYGQTKTIDVHVASLRRKLGDRAWIETVRGVGFRLREP